MSLEVTFWGVRGSIACSGPNYLRYGGNTSCVEVRTASERIILDAGTGLRELGLQMKREGPSTATILLSHTHWDHISGFPFFGPAFDPAYRFDVMSGHLSKPLTIESVLAGQMSHPFFPVPIAVMEADLTFRDIKAGETLTTKGGSTVRTIPLNHPDGATAYRIESGGASVCYVTDTEHEPGRQDPAILDLVQAADLMIYDATYTDDEYPAFRGWGHSTWQEGVRLAQAAGVKKLALFHHNPDHTDDDMDQIAQAAERAWPNAFVAREGRSLVVPGI